LEREEAINIVVGKYPEQVAAGRLMAVYTDGTQQRECYDYENPGHLTLSGPNKLGEELGVYIRQAGGPLRLWCYIKSLNKRDVNLPGDADRVIKAADLEDVYLSLTGADKSFLDNCEGLWLYPSEGTKMQIGWFAVVLHSRSVQFKEYGKVPVRVVPGRYDMRALVRGGGDKIVPFGTVDIGNENGKVYTVKLPNKK